MKPSCRNVFWLIAICAIFHIGLQAQPLDEQVKPITAEGHGMLHLSDLRLAGYTPIDVLQHIKNTFTGLLIVEFSHTGYCEPCRRFAHIFEETAQKIQNVIVGSKSVRVLFIEIDGKNEDRNTFNAAQTALNIGIRSIPSIYFFSNGSRIGEAIGFQREFSQLVESYAAKVA